jgi:predicted nucleotidyltransferase
VTSRLALRPEHERLVQRILSERLPPGVTVRVFGSRSRGSNKPYADLDLALKGGEPLSLAVLTDLAEAFSESGLPFKVDLVDWRSLGPAMQAAVDSDGVDLP